MKSIIKTAAANALATALYIVAVASFLNGLEGSFEGKKTLLVPVAMLMLFVFSAALTGALMLGRPIVWFHDGKRKEALTLLAWTLGIFFVVMLCAFGALFCCCAGACGVG